MKPDDELTRIENESIRAFVHAAADDGFLKGRVLDYGCGKRPYLRIVEEHGGDYHGWDHADLPANQVGTVGGITYPLEMQWDAILCNQVVQYVPFFFRDDGRIRRPYGEGLPVLLREFYWALHEARGCLVLTYPTNWPEVQEADLHRFTKAGMERLLLEAGFGIVRHEPRAWFDPWGGFIQGPRDEVPAEALAFGYGCVARA